jgi:hypothetical protein
MCSFKARPHSDRGAEPLQPASILGNSGMRVTVVLFVMALPSFVDLAPPCCVATC